MNQLIACCGLDCEACDARRATLTNDNDLREKTAALWTKLNGVPITPEMINCTGCRVEGAKTPFCDSLCPIRKCVREKELDTCADCAQMDGCPTLGRIAANNPLALEKLRQLRAEEQAEDTAAVRTETNTETNRGAVMMKEHELISFWKEEERAAHIHGWDFSHIAERYTEETDLPWDYRRSVLEHLKPEMKLLDIDTGGGEFLLSLHHPYKNTSAAEAYPPNVELCKQTLLPLGIDFRAGDGKDTLPFDDAAFDIVINRHGDFNAQDIHRILKDGGIFITEQVGAENDRELVELLLGKTALPFPEQYLEITRKKFRDAGFDILDAQECFRPIKFYDIGALVWFAHIIEWEFPDFSVERCKSNLLRAQKMLEQNGVVEGRIHRFLLACVKPKH